jgi:hypothetical protein
MRELATYFMLMVPEDAGDIFLGNVMSSADYTRVISQRN